MSNVSQELNELKDLCARLFILWTLDGNSNSRQHDMELLNGMFTPRVLLKKFEIFDIDIILPDKLLCIIAICSNENPGYCQILLKELLLSIKRNKGSIPKGYVVTSGDFSLAFPFDFPIILDEKNYNNFIEKWDAQKCETNHGTGNLCDTKKWWEEVMLDETE